MWESNKDKFAFCFNGIEPGIEKYALSFYSRHIKAMRTYIDSASEYCKYDFHKALTGNKLSHIDYNLNQIFTYAYSFAVGEVFRQYAVEPAIVAGYSLGIYAGLAFTRAISYKDGLRMTEKAYQTMNEVIKTHVEATNEQFDMMSVIGLSEQEIKAIITKKGVEDVFIVNSLSDTCKVLSGKKSELTQVKSEAIQQGAINAVELAVDIPYHNPVYLKEASESFKTFLEGIEWKKPDYPVISSIHLTQINEEKALREFTYRNISSPINWEGVIKTLSVMNIDNIIECGPGLTLSRNGRFIPTNTRYINIKNAKRRMEL